MNRSIGWDLVVERGFKKRGRIEECGMSVTKLIYTKRRCQATKTLKGVMILVFTFIRNDGGKNPFLKLKLDSSLV